jgi:uncharacterized protein YjdB
MRSLLVPAVAALSLVVAACPAKVASIEVAPAKVMLKSDTQSQKLSATPKDSDGAAIEDERPVAWTSADPAVATVDASGLVKPAGSGKTTVTATIEEQTASVPVEVMLLKAIKLPSLAIVVSVGKPAEALALVFTNEKGEAITPAGDDAKVAWKTADAAVATVSDTGVITGVAPGSTTLTALVKDLKAEMAVTVTAPAEEAAAPGAPGTEAPKDGKPAK